MSNIPVQIFNTVCVIADDAESVIKVLCEVKALVSAAKNDVLEKKIGELSGQIAVMRGNVSAARSLCAAANMCGYIKRDEAAPETAPGEQQLNWLPRRGSDRKMAAANDHTLDDEL